MFALFLAGTSSLVGWLALDSLWQWIGILRPTRLEQYAGRSRPGAAERIGQRMVKNSLLSGAYPKSSNTGAIRPTLSGLITIRPARHRFLAVVCSIACQSCSSLLPLQTWIMLGHWALRRPGSDRTRSVPGLRGTQAPEAVVARTAGYLGW